MGVLIPAGFAVVAYATLTEGDSEEMLWTCGLNTTDSGAVDNLLDDLLSVWGANIQPLTSEVVTLARILLKYGPNSTGPAFELPVGVGGTEGGSLPPPNCAVLVQKHTLLGGRSHRGRCYLPGISSISAGLDSAGNIDATRTNAVTAAMESWRSDITDGDASGGAIPVVLHTASSDADEITSFVCTPKLATQRRRLRP
jgi:hypothetical protein